MSASNDQPADSTSVSWSHKGVHKVVHEVIVPIWLFDSVLIVEDAREYSSRAGPVQHDKNLKEIKNY